MFDFKQFKLKSTIARVTAEEKIRKYMEVACATSSDTFSDSTEINFVVFR